jgi:hypothetical protein
MVKVKDANPGKPVSKVSPVGGKGSAGQVAFWVRVNGISGDDELYWNNDTKQLGLGTKTNPPDPSGYSDQGAGGPKVCFVSRTSQHAFRVVARGDGGTAIQGFNEGKAGGAGHFVITNPSNPSPPLAANTLGTGPLLDLTRGGTSKFRVSNEGNVGIGIFDTGDAPPSSKLHVASDSANNGYTGITIDVPGVGTKRILVGPPDSGGTGFRSLRVEN